MESIINSIRNLFETYGFKATLIIFLIIVIVNLIKKPIIKYAGEYAERTGYDKSVVTKNIVFLPYGVAYVLVFISTLFLIKFDFSLIIWTQLSAEMLFYGTTAIAMYESIKKYLEAYASKKNTKPKEVEEKEAKKDDSEILV